MSRRFTLAACSALAALSIQTASGTPVFDTFGPLPGATFGGTGIPNDEVAIGTASFGSDTTITIALSASERFGNPEVTSDGAGTYSATPGSNFGDLGQSAFEGALWNFNFYVQVDGPGKDIDDLQFDLYYDFDPAVDTPLAAMGVWDLNTSVDVAAVVPTPTVVESSQNLLFGFLSAPGPFITPPAYGPFDPSVPGEYTFSLVASDAVTGTPVESVAIDVLVVPEPGSLALIGLGGLCVLRRRRSAS